MKISDDLKEKLAEEMHNIWIDWTEYFLNNINKTNKLRWIEQIDTPYADLTEREKDSDRKVIDRIIKIIEEYTSESCNCPNQECIINHINRYFQSGNDVEVERATILRSEWDKVLEKIKDLKDIKLKMIPR
jgi:hypothetical protein